MKYAATYDIGERKRKNNGINEDSIAITLLQDGHRNGLEVVDKSSKNQQKKNLNVRGPGDEPDKNVDGPNESATTEVYPKGGPTEDTSSQHHNSKPQDRYAGIFVLADGAGGEDAGDIASYLASTVITEKLSGPVHQARRLNTGGFGIEVPEDAFGDKLSDEEIESEIDGAILAAHREIIRYANKTQSGGTYSTVVVGVYLDNKFHYGWVGDSRAYVVNESHEEISLLTKDHAKVQQWEDSGEIDKVEGHVHPDGNEITRAIGGRSGTDPKKAQITVDTGTVSLFEEDIVVITSDGLIDAQTDAMELYREYVTSGNDEEVGKHVLEEVITDDDILDVVLEEPSLSSAAEQFVDLSNRKGGKDNISLILFSGSSLPNSPDPKEGVLPERALDPDTPISDKKTVIRDQ